MSAGLLYAAVAAVALTVVHWRVTRLSRAAMIGLALLPLLITGPALLTGRVFGPIDLAYDSEPLSSVTADFGVGEVTNAMLTDVQRLMIPWNAAVRHALAQGEWPLWNPFIFCGDILAAASEPSPWHPFHLLGYLLPLGPSLTFEATLALFVAALGAFLFARELGCSEMAAFVAAVGWMASPFLVFALQVPLGAAVLVQPLLFLATRRSIVSPRLATCAALAAVLASVVLAGHPESALHVVSVGALYGLFELWRHWRSRPPRESMKCVLGALGAGVLALLLSAVHLLPFVEALPQTAEYQLRSTYGSTSRAASSLEDSARRALRLVVPFAYGTPVAETAHVATVYRQAELGYWGSLFIAAAMAGLIVGRDRIKWFLLALVIGGTLAGVSAPGVTHVLSSLPLFDIALNERLIFAPVLALSLLAAFGVEAAMRDRAALLTKTCAVTLLLLATMILVLWPSMRASGLSDAYLRAGAMRELVPLALMLALLLQRPTARPLGLALVALFAMQRVTESAAFTPIGSVERRAFYPRTALLDALPDSPAPYRVVGVRTALMPNESAHYSFEDPRGHHGMTFLRTAALQPLWSTPQPIDFNSVDDLSRPMLDFLNVRFAIAAVADPVPSDWHVVKTFRNGQLLENTAALERAFVPRRLVFESDERATLDGLRAMTDSRETVLIGGAIDERTAPMQRRELENAAGRVTTRRQKNSLVLDATMEGNGWVVISETGWKGWRARIDGHPAKLHFANHAYLALEVPAGTHRIELRYLPRSFIIGGWLSLAALLALIATLFRKL